MRRCEPVASTPRKSLSRSMWAITLVVSMVAVAVSSSALALAQADTVLPVESAQRASLSPTFTPSPLAAAVISPTSTFPVHVSARLTAPPSQPNYFSAWVSRASCSSPFQRYPVLYFQDTSPTRFDFIEWGSEVTPVSAGRSLYANGTILEALAAPQRVDIIPNIPPYGVTLTVHVWGWYGYGQVYDEVSPPPVQWWATVQPC